MKLFKLAPLGMLTIGLTLAGCGDKDDTADDTAEADADTDADSDSDTDTDADSDANFADYVFFTSVFAGYDGAGLTSYTGLDETGAEFTQTPFVEFTIVEEEYFNSGGDERYTCVWYGDITENGLESGGQADNLFIGWDVSVTISLAEDGTPQTNCTNFDEGIWGSTDPTLAIESMNWFIGFGTMTSDFETALQSAVESGGGDWAADWAPYTFGGYLGTADADGNFIADAVGQTNYVSAFEADENMALTYDANDETIQYESDGADTLPSPAALISRGYYGFYTTAMTGG